jgi:hypothetical protein
VARLQLIAARVHPDIVTAAKRRAEREDRTVSQVIRKALTAYANTNGSATAPSNSNGIRHPDNHHA